ncbi:MAG: type II secretion system inner membrane protein GspF [Syntrophobacterales bacterium]|nr:MAG: type II secretion system inner membrane protein GspF [Syntrophobacterales bacterium]
MAVYEYKGLDGAGRVTKGIIDADTPRLARTKLRRSGIFPTEITTDRHTKKSVAAGVSIGELFARIKIQDISVMTRQMATLVGAGLPIVEALTALIDQTENARLKKVITQVRESVNEGSSLADAMSRFPKAFSELYVNMINAGESSGALDIVLRRLADFMENQVILRNKVISTLTYPIILVLVGIGILSFLLISVIPKVVSIFDDLEQALPIPTLVLISVTDFLRDYWWALLIVIGGSILALRQYFATENGHRNYDRMILRIPITGKLLRIIATTRFSRTLAILLNSGIPLLQSMDIARSVVNNTVISGAVESAKEGIREGESIAEPLRSSNVFPSMVTHMIAVGEKTGELEQMLFKVSEAYENEVETTISRMTSLLGPVVILFVAGVVLFIVLAILLPMFEMNQIIR